MIASAWKSDGSGGCDSLSPHRPDLLVSILILWLADSLGLKQAGNAFQDQVHAEVGVDGAIHRVMVSTGVHDQNLRSFMGLLNHVGEVMAIVLGQGGAEDDEVKGIAVQSFLNPLAVEGGGHMMSGFGHFGGLGGQCVFVGLAIENLDGCFVSGRGQGPS